jgi:membrane protein required for colicin V production
MPSYLDLAVLTVVLISGLLALLRGFTREVLAILSWVVAAAAAYYFHPLALPYIKPYIPKENIALAAAAAGVFFATLVVVSLITVKLSDVILDSKVGALDRTLGFLFGAVRGLLLAVVAFVFYNWLVPETSQPEWIKTARTKPILQSSGEKLREYLPDDIDSIVAKLKMKKGGPANEEPPVEPSESDQTKSAPSEAAPPEKKTELFGPRASGPHVAAAQ